MIVTFNYLNYQFKDKKKYCADGVNLFILQNLLNSFIEKLKKNFQNMLV